MAKKGKVKPSHSIPEEEERPIRIRRYRQFFLIVCEDIKTEPLYFKNFKDEFPEKTMYLKPVGTGRDPQGVVNQAIEEREKLKIECNKEVDFTWVVFDIDDASENETKIKKFEEAFAIAESKNIQIAYSNEVFELWLLLHLKKVEESKPLSRAEIYTEIQEQIRKTGNKYTTFEYDHYKSNNLIEIIKEIGNEKQAIKKAEKLLEFHKETKPIEANPSTKLHILVKELRDWIKFYND
jgi:hypothetical protein